MATLKLSDIPAINMATHILKDMKKFGDSVALVDGETEKQYTFNDVITRSERLAAGFQKLGVRKNDVIAIVSPNHLDYLVAFYGTVLCGATFQTINPLYTTDDLKRTFKECSTKHVITHPGVLNKVKDAASDPSNTVDKIIVLGSAAGCLSFESLLDPRHGGYVTPPCDPRNDVAALLSSSGTTGFPKAVRIPHFALVSNLFMLTAEAISYSPGDSIINFLPMFHIYGLAVVGLSATALGCRLVLLSKFDPDNYLRLISKYKPRSLHVVPPVMVMLAKHPALSKYDFSSLDTIVCGAAPLSEDVENKVKKRLNLKYIHQGYGMTEVGVSHANSETNNRHKSVGKLLPLMEMQIVDVDTGRVVGKGQEGEIWVRGPSTALGYLNRPRETSDMFLKDGWVRTGDIGYEDEDGYLFIVDRLKELIKYKGFQVPPATLEDILLRHDAVADVGVIGVPDEEAGELPRGFVVLKPGAKVTEQELVKFVEGLVSPHMRLRGGVTFMKEIPRSLSGKILRRLLRQQAKSKL